VAAKTVAAGETFRNEIPVGEPAPADIADQVAEFLKQSPGRSN
jgi:hypothetical protein